MEWPSFEERSPRARNAVARSADHGLWHKARQMARVLPTNVRLGHKRTSTRLHPMSALPPNADIAGRQLDVRFVPIADMMGLQGSLLGRSYPANLGCETGGEHEPVAI
jgi:hypothetical protein